MTRNEPPQEEPHSQLHDGQEEEPQQEEQSQNHHHHQQQQQQERQKTATAVDAVAEAVADRTTSHHTKNDLPRSDDELNEEVTTPYQAWKEDSFPPHNLIFRARLWSHPALYFSLVSVVVVCLLIIWVRRHHLVGTLVLTAVVGILFGADFLSRPSYYEIILAPETKEEKDEEAGKKKNYQCHVMVVPMMGHHFHRTYKHIVGVSLEGGEEVSSSCQARRSRQWKRVVLTKRVTDRLGKSLLIHPREPREFVTTLLAALDFASWSSNRPDTPTLEQEESHVTIIEGTIQSKVVVLP